MELNLQVGDRVVHPQYGVGHVVKLDEREFEPGVIRRYYEITIPGSTVWVPLDMPTFGLRKLTVKSEIVRCRKILESIPLPLTEDSRSQQSDLAARLKEGTITAHCEVVRDLAAYGAHKPLAGPLPRFCGLRRRYYLRNGLLWRASRFLKPSLRLLLCSKKAGRP